MRQAERRPGPDRVVRARPSSSRRTSSPSAPAPAGTHSVDAAACRSRSPAVPRRRRGWRSRRSRPVADDIDGTALGTDASGVRPARHAPLRARVPVDALDALGHRALRPEEEVRERLRRAGQQPDDLLVGDRVVGDDRRVAAREDRLLARRRRVVGAAEVDRVPRRRSRPSSRGGRAGAASGWPSPITTNFSLPGPGGDDVGRLAGAGGAVRRRVGAGLCARACTPSPSACAAACRPSRRGTARGS